MTDHYVPLSDLLKRWLTDPEQPALWLNTEASNLFSEFNLDPTRHQHCHFHVAEHLQHQALGLQALVFAESPQQPLNRVFWQWPKAKAEADMILAWLQSVMVKQSELWLAGHNRGGIRSAQAFLSQRGWSSQVIGKAKHCVLLRAQPPQHRTSFSLEPYWQSTEIPGLPGYAQWSLPGTFSSGRIDHGSALLLPFLKDVEGPMVDFGCGSGVLSVVAQAHQPALAITTVDHHWLAVISSQQTALRNGMNWQVLWRDELPPGPWQTIVSNPPFHSGLNVQYEVTHSLLQQAQLNARPGGALWLVVNDHLPYGDWLKAYTQSAVNECHQGGYRVWRAHLNPRTTA